MLCRSIRWRLPLSYAVIALLAAIALGSVLLLTLRRYYRQQELDYLINNAQAISTALSRLYEIDPSPATLSDQLRGFSFLSQTRVGLLDAVGQLLIADSGPPQVQQEVAALSLGGDSVQDFSVWAADAASPLPDAGVVSVTKTEEKEILIVRRPVDRETVGSVVSRPGVPVAESSTSSAMVQVIKPLASGRITETVMTSSTARSYVQFTSAVPTLYGFGLNAETPSVEQRSELVVRHPIYDASGALLGQIELSEGPSYGRQILDSVTQSWAIASAVAVLLAAGVGWWMSRRLTKPLVALTGITGRMAEGDLSARAEVARQDELGTLARSFNEMAGQVEGTVGMLRRFVADAAHALHTPLTALRTNLELAAQEIGDAQQGAFLARAQVQVERLTALTNNLLDLSRLETVTGRRESFSPVELVGLVREVGEAFASRADQAELRFALELSETPVVIEGQAAQLRQALGNLLDNAIKFTGKGGEIQVGLCREAEWVVLWVQDTGIGVPAPDLPQLFQRFHRGRNAAAYPGSGLGLAVVKAVAERHGGKVGVHSGDAGTRFAIRLPALVEASE